MEKFLERLRAFERHAEGLAGALAPFVVAQVQDNITTMKEPPNAELTKRLKGDKGPLKDTGELRASITRRVEGGVIRVGTALKRAPLLHHGGTVAPQSAKKLAVPAARNVKLYADVRGVRGFLDLLRGQGWRVWFTAGAVLGRPPKGVKARFGLKTKQGNRLLFIRKPFVKIPPRPFIRLRPRQMAELRRTAEEYLDEAVK